MSDFIITLDVGGQMIKTQISTLTKYPDSMLAIMFQHTANGLAPMPMTKDGAYGADFLDANPGFLLRIHTLQNYEIHKNRISFSIISIKKLNELKRN